MLPKTQIYFFDLMPDDYIDGRKKLITAAYELNEQTIDFLVATIVYNINQRLEVYTDGEELTSDLNEVRALFSQFLIDGDIHVFDSLKEYGYQLMDGETLAKEFSQSGDDFD